MSGKPEEPRWKRRRAIAVAIGGMVVGALVVALVVVVSYWSRETAERSGRDVPLGVEAAVIIRYAGPQLVARPYRRGASVDVRIANEAQQGSVRIYDLRYVVNLPGEFDLMEYLMSADGIALDELPPFRVRGQTSLTKQIETRIREIEDAGVQVWHWYYETLAGLGVVWVLWLLGLILIGLPKRPPKPVPPAPEPSLAELIAQCFETLSRGGLSVEQKARLEILLFRHWRGRLSRREDRMAAACRQIQQDPTLGRAYNAVESWLHDPAAPVGLAEIVKLCKPQLGDCPDFRAAKMGLSPSKVP
jgi:hypothetical protein